VTTTQTSAPTTMSTGNNKAFRFRRVSGSRVIAFTWRTPVRAGFAPPPALLAVSELCFTKRLVDTMLVGMTKRGWGRLSSGLLFAISLLVVAQPLLADTIYFRDGREANGKIVSQSSTEVTIQTATGKWTYNRGDVIRIDYDTLSPVAVRQTPVATPAALALGQTVPRDASAERLGIEVGGSFGLIRFPETISLKNVGAFASVEFGDGIALRVAYSHAEASLFGLELLGIDLLEASLVLDVAPGSPFSAYVLGGGTYFIMYYTLSGEEDRTTFLFLAGAGIRLNPTEFITIRAGYLGRFKYGLVHGVVAEVSIRF